MKKVAIILLSVLSGLACYAQNTQEKLSDNKLKTRLDSLVNSTVSAFMNDSSRVGLSIGIIKDGISLFYNYGTTEKGKRQIPTANSVYELASITKTFSSALLAKAVLDKKVKLDDDIRLYLDGKYPNLEYKGVPIKLINLANLTSGLPNWMPDNKDLFSKANPDSIPYILDAIHKKYSRADLYRDLHHVKLDTVPGSVTRHCNTAAQLLGYIMERVYGARIDQLLKKYFAEPLKMRNTAFLADGKLPAALVKGYDGKGRVMPFIVWEDLRVAASISSTTSDM
ncbi:MAG: serine hydrolase domain-containing protein, partial [Mucilaginibacter sp.]|uniref:serine hydrolase domain-containing protein n=1 Tax=Mucilaginibacter sp. TaxID=1882438 RepID=UPI003569BFC6